MKIAIRLAFVALAMGVAGSVLAADTLRIDSQVLVVGDSASHALELLGQPLLREPVENQFGAHLGEHWQFSREGHVITLLIRDGKVVQIEDATR